MTDLDHMQRRLSDLEAIVREQGYRIKALEKAGEKPKGRPADQYKPTALLADSWGYVRTWCSCGRDLCRAPDCPSHKPDPLAR